MQLYNTVAVFQNVAELVVILFVVLDASVAQQILYVHSLFEFVHREKL